MLPESRQRMICVIADYVTLNIALLLFNVVRYYFLSESIATTVESFLCLKPVLLGQAVIPLVTLLIFYLSGYYYNVVFRSRLGDLVNTLITTLIASFVIYFAILFNDPVEERGEVFLLIGVLWGILFAVVFPVRFILTLAMVRRIYNRKFGYKTLIIGTSTSAASLAQRLNTRSSSMGFNVVGFVSLEPSHASRKLDYPTYNYDELDEVIRSKGITRLIVMPHHKGMHSTTKLLNSLFHFGLPIYISPTFLHMVSGRVNLSNIKGEPLVNIARPAFSPMSASIKRFTDIVFSTLALAGLLPFMLITAVAIKFDSRGPVFFTQERIGFCKRPFKILKFRTMLKSAEENGPALSSANDPRVTRVGRFLRRYRIDELPQFVNVIKGDMSIVGPRPERAYYIDQIMKRAPYFSLIHQVRPGITSLGMVKFGYASTVDEMIRRLRYDILYLENASLGIDLKIMFYTIRTVATGRGV